MRIFYLGSGRLSFRTKLIVGVIIALSVALLTLISLLAIGAMLVLLPVFALGAILYAFLPKRKRAHPNQPDVLEGRYRVVDKDRLPPE